MFGPWIAALIRSVGALAACAAGATCFWVAGGPAPWLTGSALVATIAALAGTPPRVPARLMEAALLILGLTLGATTGQGSLDALSRWPGSILALMLTVPLTVGSAQLLLMRVFGWGAKEAFLAAVPGALSYTLAIAVAENLDVRKIAIVQSLRLLAIVLLVPLTFQHAAGLAASGGLLAAVGPTDWLSLAALAAAGIAASFGMSRIGAPAAPMIGGLLISGIAHATGLVTGTLPAELTVPAVVLIGANVGSRFAGSDLKSIAATFIPSLLCVGATFVTSALAGAATALALGLPMLQTLLAFAPGGADTIAVLVLSLKLDGAFVTVHQLVRFLGIAATLPVLFRLLTPATTRETA